MRKPHLIALAALLALAACGRNDPPPPPAGDAATGQASDSVVGRKIQQALAEASEKLATANIPVGGRVHNGVRVGRSGNELPRAEITPQGDLLIEGKAVEVDQRQRELLLAHRGNLVAIAQAGIAAGAQGAELGMQGAALGIKAAKGAIRSAISGNSDEFEKQMEAEGKRIEAEGRRIEAEIQRGICARLPAVLDSQQALAAALPAFAPYATMDQSDVSDCGRDGDFEFPFKDVPTVAGSTPGDTGHVTDAAAEADAAAKDASSKQ